MGFKAIIGFDTPCNNPFILIKPFHIASGVQLIFTKLNVGIRLWLNISPNSFLTMGDEKPLKYKKPQNKIVKKCSDDYCDSVNK